MVSPTLQRTAPRTAETITGKCLYDNDGDQFFADITYVYREHQHGNTIIHVEAAFSPIVQVDDAELRTMCMDAIMSEIDVESWEFTDVERTKRVMTEKEQEKQSAEDLREMAHYYGSWDDLRKVIAELEQADKEAAYDRAYDPEHQ